MTRGLTHITVLAIFLWSGCTLGDDDGNGDPPFEVEVKDIIPQGDEAYLTTSSDYLFDQDEIRDYHLLIPEDNLRFLDRDPAAEQYVEGMLVFEGDTISPVGVRYKGSIGAFVGCLSGWDILNPSGRKECTKLSMKVKINWEGRSDKFFGLKKLQFHAQNLDDSQMRERLGYWLFAQMGVPTPRCVHARLHINGKYNGLFGLVEQIDGRFAKYHFPQDDDGNVYKEVWPLLQNGEVAPSQDFIDALKTNEDNPSVGLMQAFATDIKNASDSQMKAVIAKYMNVEEIMSYWVVDRAISHDDGPYHWYCGGPEGCTNHNYYWYEEPNNEKFHLVPWDLDNAFETIGEENEFISIAGEWGDIFNDCEPFKFDFWKPEQWSAPCDKLTNGWVQHEVEYEELLEEFRSGPFAKSSVESKINTWRNQIAPSIKEAEEMYGDATSELRWNQSLDQLKELLEISRNR